MKVLFVILFLTKCLTTFADENKTPQLFYESDLNEFYTDGCSRFPEGNPMGDKNLWLPCCYHHDKKYFTGGTALERKQADYDLYACVKKASGSAILARAMYMGVRMGGKPSFDTNYRWGYGWPFGRGYQPLTLQESQWTHKKIANFDCLKELQNFTSDRKILRQACQ